MVIDASVVFKWFFPEDGHQKAREWVGKAELVGPTLLHTELGNALWKRALRGEIGASGPEIAAQLAGVANVVRTIDETPLVPRAVELAVSLGHPVYDCVYLALAEALDDRVLTADARFLSVVEGTPFEQKVVAL